jgi:hypothetical protein
MKKIILFIAVISAFSFASCKKDRTCTCVSSNGTTTNPERVFTLTKVTKSQGRANCLSSTETNNNGSTTTTTCTLK